MLRSVGNDLFLALLASDIHATFHGALQVPRLVELLFIKVTGLAAPVRHHEV